MWGEIEIRLMLQDNSADHLTSLLTTNKLRMLHWRWWFILNTHISKAEKVLLWNIKGIIESILVKIHKNKFLFIKTLPTVIFSSFSHCQLAYFYIIINYQVKTWSVRI